MKFFEALFGRPKKQDDEWKDRIEKVTGVAGKNKVEEKGGGMGSSSGAEVKDRAPQGWKTARALVRFWPVGSQSIKNAAEKYRDSHSDWFHDYAVDGPGQVTEHYHPDLVAQLEKDLKVQEQKEKRSQASNPPDGWKTPSALTNIWFGSATLFMNAAEKYRDSHPNWFHNYWSKKLGSITEYYHPDLIAQLEKDLKVEERKKSIVKQREKISQTEKAPIGWETPHTLSSTWPVSPPSISKAAQPYRADHPDWFHGYWSGGSRGIVEHYHPDLVAQLEKDLKVQERKEKESKVDKPPEGWNTPSNLSIKWKGTKPPIIKAAEKYRDSHPKWFHVYWSRALGEATEYYHPDLVIQLAKDLNIEEREKKIVERRERVSKAEKAPKGWRSPGTLSVLWFGSPSTIAKAAQPYRADHPDWFHDYSAGGRGDVTEHYHPDLVAQIEKDLKVQERKEKESRSSKAPDGWKTPFALTGLQLGGVVFIRKTAETYRISHPDWFHEYWSIHLGDVTEHYHPDLTAQLELDLADRIVVNRERYRQKELLQKFEAFLDEVRKGTTKEAQEVQEMLEVFGSSRYLDVIHSFRAEFKDVPQDDVRGMIAIYLGDHLGGGGKGPKNWRNHELIKERLSSLTFREGLSETLKEDCYHYYLDRRRAGDVREPIALIESYREYLAANCVDLSHPGFKLVIDETIKYCKELWTKYKKPERFVDSLKSDREFPDINQRMNIKELAEKQRIIIADEMGVGKSASAIMAKEELHVPCALVIVPSNVMETWKGYLSDNPKGGYFKPGQAPRMLVIESTDQLEDAAKGNYEYVLISQERLGERYNAGLLKIPYTMLIADEFHKMKSLSGTRSSSVLALAEKVEKGKDTYLALLSGTPIPNKIMDVVVGLKMLYPERFKKTTNWALAMQIIKGDVIDLRKLLLPRLQMKKLRDCVEMPPLTEEVVEVEMNEMEKEVYSVLFENDELTYSEKLVVLRKFNLNPSAIDSTPGFKGAKAERVAESIQNAFVSKKKVLLFVNDQVEDVIRGERTIMDTLNIPQGVKVLVIHGEVPTRERTRIQEEFQDRINDQKILLIVSGQTADVGVDYSAAEEVLFYNEPWTEYGKNQQLGRANRPGLAHPLHATTFINKGTIEEGIHRYIRAKYLAIQKVLKGIPLNEMEIELLEQDEKRDEAAEEVNPELAKYYFSAWDRMMQYFGHAKEMGEERSREFIKEYGKDYAEGYRELGSRSYQANANRISGTLIERMIDTGLAREEIRILDLASGPQMLKRHIGEKYQGSIISMDANAHHFSDPIPNDCVVGSWTKIPFPDESFDVLNFALALHQTEYVPSRGKLERLEVLMELNRVLKVGGRAVIPMIYGMRLKNELMFSTFIERLGFKIVPDYSGRLASGIHYQGGLITLEKTQKLDTEVPADELIEDLSKDEREGLKFKEVNDKVRDTRKIATQFTLDGNTIETRLNERDRGVLQEEQDVVRQAEIMKKLHGGRIEAIPAAMIIENGFVRIRLGDKYILFKRLMKKSGVVVVK